MKPFLRFRAASMRPAFVLSVLLSVVSVAGASAAPGDLTVASTSDDEVKGDMDSFNASLSADGTSVAFDSFATNLELADPDDLSDVYVKDLVTGDLVLASTNGEGVKGDNSSSNASLALGGSHVAFDSVATNLDLADMVVMDADVYVKELASGGLTLASATSDGVKGDGASIMPSLSADGAWVAFSSSSTNLDTADPDVTVDIYVKDLETGAIMVVSTADDGTKGNGDSSDPSLSADGTRVAFSSASTNLDPADMTSDIDVYVKDLATGDITLASIADDGSKADGSSSAPSLSSDGSTVAFSSFATNLDAADDDVAEDVYVKDLGGDLVLASTSDDET
jgi:Tol biopolymer transport system component